MLTDLRPHLPSTAKQSSLVPAIITPAALKAQDTILLVSLKCMHPKASNPPSINHQWGQCKHAVYLLQDSGSRFR